MKINDDKKNMNSHDIKHILRIIEQIMEDAFHDLTHQAIEPDILYAYGFNLYLEEDGTPHIELIKPLIDDSTHKPLRYSDKQNHGSPIDIIEYDDSIAITTEVFGFNNDHISITTDNKQLIISINEPDWEYQETIELPCEVDTTSLFHSYNNGMLDITIKKK